MVHELLTKQQPVDEASGILADTLLENLLAALQMMVRPGQIDLDVEAFELTGKQATAVSLIVNEAVMNAVKHGAGDVHVSFRQLDGDARLKIWDDGPGFPPGFDPIASANTGLDLITMAAKWDLRGSASFDNAPGSGGRVTVIMPLLARVTS
jgi:two-component sensor histidine kinase